MELISESPQQLLALLNSVPSDAWGVVIETIVSAFVVSPLALGLKKWLSVDSEHKMLGLVISDQSWLACSTTCMVWLYLPLTLPLCKAGWYSEPRSLFIAGS
jgi:hypothetical protein